jgi:hypothetical protein
MPRLRPILLASILCATGMLAVSTSVHAQPENAQPAPAQAKTAPEPEPSPLLIEPKSPEELFAGALLMVDLARIDLAGKYLEQFEAASPDDELLLKLRDKHGTGEFLKLSRIKELQPLSTQLLDRLSEASRKQSENPEFVDALIARLGGDPTQRELAIREFRNAGPRAVPQMLRQLRQPESAAQQDSLVIALTRMGRQVVPPLIGAMDAPEERVRAAIIGVLGSLDATEAIPYLWYPAFSEEQPLGVRIVANRTLAKLISGSPEKTDRLSSVAAANELRRLAKLLYTNSSLLPREEDGTVAIWGWDEKEGTVAPHRHSPQVASMLLSSRFASQSLALSPEQPEPQRQYLASLLGLQVLQQGWDKPRQAVPGSAMYLAMTAGEETVSAVLADALEAGQAPTATAALEVLAQIGTREQLLGLKGVKSPVLAALNSPDPRVQFAAATAILRIEPQSGFPGSNRVVAVLARALTDPGSSQAIVIDADNSRGSQTLGYLSELGYEGVVASTGREGFEKAATSAGVNVIIVHANCVRWELTQTLSNFRADARTAAIPIVVYGAEPTRSSVARLVGRSKPAVFVGESAGAADFRRQFVPFINSVSSPPLSAQERHQQMLASAYWLATLATIRGAQVFDVTPAEKSISLVVENPDVGANAVTALSGISTGSSQRRLSGVALNSQLDPALRQLAATQLAFHIQRFGLLLTKDDVTAVNTSWQAAEQPELKAALGSVMGSLRPNATLVGERLRQFPSPTGRTP